VKQEKCKKRFFRLIQGDVFKGLALLESDSIDCVVTSPPYWGLRDYGVEGQLGLEKHPQEYIQKMVEVFRAVRRVLKPAGTLWLNLGDSYYGGSGHNYDNINEEGGQSEDIGKPTDEKRSALHANRSTWLRPKQMLGMPWRTAIALQEDGWLLRNAVVWNKTNGMPASVRDRFANKYEFVFLFVKSPRYNFNLDAVRVPHKTPHDTRAVTTPYGESNRLDHRPAKGEARRKQFNKAKRLETGEASASPEARAVLLNPLGANPGDVFEVPEFGTPEYEKWYFNQREKKGWHDHARDLEKGMVGRGGIPNNLPHPFGAAPGDLWRFASASFKGAHFAVFPEELPRRCITAGCPPDGVVLDPFAGSGTTLQVARELGRSAIGIELNPNYYEFIKKRVKWGVGLDVEFQEEAVEQSALLEGAKAFLEG
jgi:site-specific DNA-methyltransferase (cytosine-N4-specific)